MKKKEKLYLSEAKKKKDVDKRAHPSNDIEI